LVFALQSEQKWKQLAELAIRKCEFGLAQECLHQAQDFGGLLLLASSAGNAEMVTRLASTAQAIGHNNVAFLSNFILGKWVDLFICCLFFYSSKTCE
jgi:coatomer subunit beta'